MSCDRLTKFVEAPSNLERPPAELEVPCNDPVLLPDQDLTVRQAAGSWLVDRSSLAACRDKNAALLEFYSKRDAAIIGEKRGSRR